MDLDDLDDADNYANRSPTLICDYSENDLNQLFLKSKQMEQEHGGDIGPLHTDLNSQMLSNSSPGKISANSGDRYN